VANNTSPGRMLTHYHHRPVPAWFTAPGSVKSISICFVRASRFVDPRTATHLCGCRGCSFTDEGPDLLPRTLGQKIARRTSAATFGNRAAVHRNNICTITHSVGARKIRSSNIRAGAGSYAPRSTRTACPNNQPHQCYGHIKEGASGTSLETNVDWPFRASATGAAAADLVCEKTARWKP